MGKRFEIRTVPDSGFTIPGGEPWSGWQVRYRPAGSRGRFASFLLTAAALPTTKQLKAICELHASGKYRDGDVVELTPAP